jgi:hypothetical protein
MYHNKRKVGTMPEVRQGSWMNPLNKVIWRKAFKKRQKEVQLNDGRMFRCNYSLRPGLVWIEPIGGEKVPCGWINLKRAEENEWLDS